MGKLYIVATPIGNLEDMTFRAVRILKEVDLIATEDTRTTKKLTDHYEIDTSLTSYFQHSGPDKIAKIIQDLVAGKNVALVSEAGTPTISDPGVSLVSEAVKNGIEVEPVPGSAAVIAGASVSGLPVDRFAFYGFLPLKKGRQKMQQKMLTEDKTVIFYESPHRIIKTLEQLNELADHDVQIVVCRELTKMFEEKIRGNLPTVIKDLNGRAKVKGEIVVVMSNSNMKK